MNDKYLVDARGLSCPQPVLETKKVLEDQLSNDFIILVDNYTAKENVSRFARNQGWAVEVSEKGDHEFSINIKGDGRNQIPEEREELLACPAADQSTEKGLVVYVATDSMGVGDRGLGVKLIRGFLRTLIDVPPLPWRVIFINSGVKLCVTDDEAVEAVGMLEQKGVEILACGTCLQHFGLDDKLEVGRSTNMYEVIESLSHASKVISPD
jgi:selenium metabolism protein YedF